MILFRDPTVKILTFTEIMEGSVADPSISSPYQDTTLGVISGGRYVGSFFENCTFKSSVSGARVEMFPSPEIGIRCYDNTAVPVEVFKVLVAGTDVGDVVVGNYAGGQGAKYDKSLDTFSITGGLTAGSIAIGTTPNWFKVDTSGNIWSGADTLVNAIASKFAVTNAGAFYATGATISGTITATAGAIGGFDIGADYIRDAANTFGLASTVTVGDDVRFWAGDTFANRATADFRVTKAGVVNASKMTISGGADVSFISDTLDTSTKTILKDFTFGSTDYSGAFKTGDITWNTTTGAITGGSGGLFNKNGLVFASAGVPTITLDGVTGAATFAGKITASEGLIGGWAIASGYLYTSTEIAGFNTGLLSPTASGGKYNNWTDPTNAYSSNNVYATQTARSLGYWNIPQSYETFGISIPAGATITGIEVSVEGKYDGDSKSLRVDIYNNSSTSWATESTNIELTTSDVVYTKGGSADLWGKTWVASDFSNANFSVVVLYYCAPSSPSGYAYLDHIQVKVYYQTGGTAGMAPADYPYWAAATYANRATAPFRVDSSGVLSVDTLGNFPVTPSSAPDANYEVANKKYVDDNKGISYGIMTFSPQYHTEISSVDGVCERTGVADSWATIIAGAGTTGSDTGNSSSVGVGAACTTIVETPWGQLYRSIFLFDTSDLPDDCTIISATFSFFVATKQNDFTAQTAPFGLMVVGSAPASNTALATGDFQTMGTTVFAADYINYGDVSTTIYNTFALNAAGLAAISKTGATKLGLRMRYDGTTSGTPDWENSKLCKYYIYMADDTDKQRIPKLKVVFQYA